MQATLPRQRGPADDALKRILEDGSLVEVTTWQNAPETVHEEGINVLLEQLLRGQGLTARAERRSRRGVLDVVVELRSGDSVVLECKWDRSVSLLESQLDERLKAFPEALGLVGVLYPDSLRHQEDTYAGLEAATDLQWWLHGSCGLTSCGQSQAAS